MNGPYEHAEAQALSKDFQCSQCGGVLLAAWGGFYAVQGYVARCGKDPAHEGAKRKGRPTRNLYDHKKGWIEHDMTTQQPTQTAALALPDNETGMTARVKEALDVGLFPEKTNPKQMANLVKVALLYRLDPLMREIMPYQGQPYITIEGRRRIDARAGNAPSISIAPMPRDERETYIEMGAINEGDVVVKGRFSDPKTGATIEATGRVLVSERNGNVHLPTVKWPLEMAFKRCESRGRRMLYGPVALPGGMDEAERLYEEDDVVVVEGTAIDVTDQAEASAAPQPTEVLTIKCPVHDEYWRADGKQVYHEDEDEQCSPSECYDVALGWGKQAMEAWIKLNMSDVTGSAFEMARALLDRIHDVWQEEDRKKHQEMADSLYGEETA